MSVILDLIGIGSFLFLLRLFYMVTKENGKSFPCTTILGRILAHHYVVYGNTRVCKICGMIQFYEDRGFLWADGEVWYVVGYAKDKEKYVKQIIKLQEEWEYKNNKYKTEKDNKIKNTLIE